MIAATGAVYISDSDNGLKIFLFKKVGEWKDAKESVQFEIPGYDSSSPRSYFPIRFISSTEIAASVLAKEGDWYTGKVFIVKAADTTWQNLSSQVIFKQPRLSIRSDFGLKMIWNGSQLVRSVGSQTFGFTARDAVVSQTLSGGFWGSLQQVTLSRYNSASFYFGNAVHKDRNALFSGAPYDGSSGKGAGAVYVYVKTGDSFEKIHTIFPSARRVRPDGSSDTRFGYSVTSFENELAIGAPSYRYAMQRSGKIFLYKRTGATWASATLYDSLSPPAELMLDHVKIFQ